jgi:hypothetical protein
MLIDHITLDDIYRFLETGNPDNAPQEIVRYLELLDKCHSLILRIDSFGNKNAILKHFMVTEKLSRYKASQIYNETIEYFYMDKQVSKRAWANFYANILDQEINYARLTKTTPADSKVVGDLVRKAAELRGVFEAEKEELPEELFQKPIVVYTGDILNVGLPKADRNKIKELIDKKVPNLTEKEKQRLYQEAELLPFKVFPHEQEDPRKT